MNRRIPLWTWIATVLAVATLTTACGQVAKTHHHGSLSIAHNQVRISVPNAPAAYVQSGGGLVIGTRTVRLTPAEQRLARRYYRDTLGITAAGAATGKAGGELGLSIIGSMFSALWHDNASIIKHTARSGAAKVHAHVAALCEQLADLHNVQNALAAALPAFAPYRVIGPAEVRHCRQDAERHADVTYSPKL